MQTGGTTFSERTADASHSGVLLSRQALLDFAPLLTLYLVYTLMRWLLVERGAVVGADHATEIIRFERWLGMDWEIGLQSLILSNHLIARLANFYYVFGFFPVLIAAAVIAAQRAPAVFAWWRKVFAVSLGLAIIGFACFPLTPPRLLPESYGYVDTLLRFGPHYYGDQSGGSLFNAYGSIPSMVNVHAAMPSMHVGWSVVASVLILAAFPGRKWVRSAAIAHPILMGVAVVATANHYVLDVFAGLAVLAGAYVIAQWLEQHSYLKSRIRSQT